MWSLDTSRIEPVFVVRIRIERDGDVYHGFCPELDCIHVCGDSETEAEEAAVDAVKVYLRMSLSNGDPIPIGLHAGRPTRITEQEYKPVAQHEILQRDFVEEVRIAHA